MIQTLKNNIPWQLKVLVKVLLSSLLPSKLLFKIKIFSHGKMNEVQYAIDVFFNHYKKVKDSLSAGFVICELGPGDSSASGIIAYYIGANNIYLVDSDKYSDPILNHHDSIYKNLSSLDIPLRAKVDHKNIEILKKKISYLTNGLTSLRDIPSNTVDFIFSNAVLEHVKLHEFPPLIRELYRILKPGGYMSHKIDLKDHLEYSLNNLRFPAWLWESEMVHNSNFYTNRLRWCSIKKEFNDSGFKIIDTKNEYWENIPIEKKSLSKDFLLHASECLLIKDVEVLLLKE